MVVRPGFVRTKMTAGPGRRAVRDHARTRWPAAIVKGLRRGAHTVWAPPILRFVFAGLRHLPRPVFRRLDL